MICAGMLVLKVVPRANRVLALDPAELVTNSSACLFLALRALGPAPATCAEVAFGFCKSCPQRLSIATITTCPVALARDTNHPSFFVFPHPLHNQSEWLASVLKCTWYSPVAVRLLLPYHASQL